MTGFGALDVDAYLRLDGEEEARGSVVSRGRLLSVAGAVAGGLALAGAPTGLSATPKRGGVLTFGETNATPRDSLDPARSIQNAEYELTNLIFDGLTTFEYGTWRVHPSLATSWKSNPAGTQWTFALRRGVRFSDGSAFTANDVGWTLKRILNKALGAANYGRLSQSLDPSGIEIVNPYTVRLHLKQPDATLPLALASRNAFIVKNGTTRFTPRTMIGTGPFTLVSWSPGQTWEVKRNPRFWRAGLPYLDGVRMVAFADQTSIGQAVISGNIDCVSDIDFGTLDAARRSKNLYVIPLKSGSNQEICMDLTQAPFTDRRVVLALKLALDRRAILKTVYLGRGVVTADIPAPPSDPYYPKGFTRAQDIRQARQLLAAAGHANGIDLELFTTDGLPYYVDLAVAAANVVKDARIRIKVMQTPAATYFNKAWMVKPMFISNWLRRPPTEVLPLLYTSTAANNESRFKSPLVDRLAREALGTVSRSRQIQQIQRAFRIVANDAGIAVPLMVDKVALCDRKFAGVKRDTNVSLDLRSAHLA